MGTIHHGNAYAVLNQQIQNLYGSYKDLAANAVTGRNQVALRNVQQIEDHLTPIRACLDLLIRGADPGVAPTPKSNKTAEATNAEPTPAAPNTYKGVPIEHLPDLSKPDGGVTTSPPVTVAPAETIKPKPVNPLGGLRKPKSS